MEKKEKIYEFIDNIIELVEDKEFPAKRSITDYVALIIGQFDYELYKEVENYIECKYLELSDIEEEKSLLSSGFSAENAKRTTDEDIPMEYSKMVGYKAP